MSLKKEIPPVFTALVTPFAQNGAVDEEGLKTLIHFLTKNGMRGFVPVGTTGEAPTLTGAEHVSVIEQAIRSAKILSENSYILAGVGSNCTAEAIHYSDKAVEFGADGLLVVTPYYNCPSSSEVRTEYYNLIAGRFPAIPIIPYVISGRTGCTFNPEDLWLLTNEYSNVVGVKYAEPDLENVRIIRGYIPHNFTIFSGDDNRTLRMMRDDEIKAGGVISVISNIAPAAVIAMCNAALEGNFSQAQRLHSALSPLFESVTVAYQREVILPDGRIVTVQEKVRNPVAIKTMMHLLGMGVGPCRPPLGCAAPAVLEKIKKALRTVWENNPWVLKPIKEFFLIKDTDWMLF